MLVHSQGEFNPLAGFLRLGFPVVEYVPEGVHKVSPAWMTAFIAHVSLTARLYATQLSGDFWFFLFVPAFFRCWLKTKMKNYQKQFFDSFLLLVGVLYLCLFRIIKYGGFYAGIVA